MFINLTELFAELEIIFTYPKILLNPSYTSTRSGVP